MNNSLPRKIALIAIATVFFICLMSNYSPTSGISARITVSADTILLVTETALDSQLAVDIVSLDSEMGGNYSTITLDDFNMMCSDSGEDCLNIYSTVILLSINLSDRSLSNQSIDLITSRISSGMSFVVVSSKIWRLNEEIKDLLGVSTRQNNSEFTPSQNEDIELTINNDSLFISPYVFSYGQVVNISARACYIDSVLPDTTTLATADNLGGHIDSWTGIFLQHDNTNFSGKILTIPFSVQGANNNTELTKLIISAANDLAIFSSAVLNNPDNTSVSTNTDTTTTTENELNRPPLFKESDIQTVVIVGATLTGGIALAGLAINQIGSIKKTDADVKDSSEWDSRTSWLLFIIAPIIAIFSQIIYSPRIRKIDALRVKDNLIRRDIVELLELNGFEHFNSLKNQLKTGVSVLKWHLQVLEDFGMVKSMTYGQFSVFYLSGKRPSAESVKIYFTLRSNKAFKIANEFLKINAFSVQLLSEKLSMNRDTTKYHCYKLVSANLLTVDEDTGIFTLKSEMKTSLKEFILRSDLMKNTQNFRTSRLKAKQNP